MEKFLQNVGKRLNPGGEVHLNHKDVYPYTKWNLEGHAAACGLHLLRKLPFSLPHLRHQFPTYCNRRGYGLFLSSATPSPSSSANSIPDHTSLLQARRVWCEFRSCREVLEEPVGLDTSCKQQ